jgi:hypothetical protein
MSAGRRSRRKGANGEREFRDLMRTFGFTVERTGRSARHTKDDLGHDLVGVHIEVKRREKLCIPQWMRQSRTDAGPNRVPTVAHRRNNEEWLMTVPATWLLGLLARYNVDVTTKGDS